jgi:RNA polymerase sigma factor (sigma-70 family)
MMLVRKVNIRSNTDNKLIGKLYELYGRKVYNFLLKMTGDGMLAEDISHDTFIQVFEKYESFRGESSIQTWIFTIAKNIYFRHYNKMKRIRFLDMENIINNAADSHDKSQYSSSEKQLYVGQIKEGCLLGLLRCLSYYQRIAFVLHVLNGFPIKETSEVVLKSPNATRILIHRARENLKTFLCRNCSLYHGSNPCRCENLISFSLNQGWIKKGKESLDPVKIEQELRSFGDEISLYKTLDNSDVPANLTNRIMEFVENRNFSIFRDKKVK